MFFWALCSHAFAFSYDDTTFNAGLELSFINRGSYNNSYNSSIDYFKASSSDSKLAIQKNEPGVNAYVGMRFSMNWGGQVGFGFVKTAKANVPSGQAANKISNIFLDGLGFINIAHNLDLMGLLGIGMLKSNPSVTDVTIYDQSALSKQKIGIRLGGGLQYYFAESFATRFSVVYQEGNSAFLRNMLSCAIGLVYTFDM